MVLFSWTHEMELLIYVHILPSLFYSTEFCYSVIWFYYCKCSSIMGTSNISRSEHLIVISEHMHVNLVPWPRTLGSVALTDGCLRFLHLSGSGQEADDFSCCDACIMNQCAQWPTCDQQRCTLLWLGGALSSPLSRSTHSTQLRGRPASMGIHVAKSQSVSERRKPWLCSLPHQPSLLPKKELFIWAWNQGQPAVYKCVELAFLGNSAVVLYWKTSFHHTCWKH